jgi:hypothetical protein
LEKGLEEEEKKNTRICIKQKCLPLCQRCFGGARAGECFRVHHAPTQKITFQADAMHRPGAARVQFNAATTIGFKKPL